ncbi:MAG: N(4)-(beta-N-acetylglucosaminyl)-L-asparaginase [Bacteroidota bacterium]
MGTRRKFCSEIALGSLGVLAIAGTSSVPVFAQNGKNNSNSKFSAPLVLSTWSHGIPANDVALKILKENGKALDAVEQGVRIPEADPEVTSVGYGGFPDRDGNVTLDACIMDEKANCGSVACLQNIMHPISVARKVMETTPHILLVGEGAQQFALDNGFKKENLLTEKAKEAWQKWLKDSNYKPVNFDNHDTIGMVALDMQGNLSGACTTSGLAWKYHGRVGDSPIIGAGLYVDNEIGAACATGKGEAVIKIAGSFLIVELMRQGKSPQDACEIAMKRLISKNSDYKTFQIGFLAINKEAEFGAYGLQKGFQYALGTKEINKLYDSDYFLK